MLVDRLATRWGVRRQSAHKTVWAEMPVESGRRASHLTSAPAWGQGEQGRGSGTV